METEVIQVVCGNEEMEGPVRLRVYRVWGLVNAVLGSI